MRNCKWGWGVAGAFVGMILCCASLMAQTNTYPFPSSGSVGIGTTSPGAPLDVVGTSTWTAAFERGGNTLYLDPMWGGVGSSGPVALSTNSGASLALQPDGGYVGVGTPSPARALDVTGYGYAGLGPAMRLSNPAGQAADKARIELADAGTLRSYIEWNIIPGGTATWNFYDSFNSTSRMFIDQSGNMGVGTTGPGSKLEVNGSVKLTQGSGASITFADGTVQSTAYTGTCTATGGDYAEAVDVTGEKSGYEPGDIIVLDPKNPKHFLLSAGPYSKLVAGIYSTKPGYVGRRQKSDPSLAAEIPMAMVGVVPTKVTAENGPVEVGDLLVTSSRTGYAMKGTDTSKMLGAVVGKAMEPLDSGTGVIEVLVTLQ